MSPDLDLGFDLDFQTNEGISRRKALSVLGTTAVGAFAGMSVAGGHGGDGGGPQISDFHVEGRKVWIRKDHPDYYEITRRTISPDLRERYGDPIVESTKRFDKTRHEKMLLPDSAEYRIENKNFSANMAKEEEWREYFISRRDSGAPTGIAALMPLTVSPSASPPEYEKTSDHKADDDDFPMGVWTYSEDNGNYTAGSPINAVGILGVEPDECKNWNTGGDPADMISELVGAGWARNIEEYERFAWNRVTAEFESNQNETKGNGSSGESWGRVTGGHHVRGWEWVEESPDDYGADNMYGRYASLQCHFDSEVPHTATGYKCAQREVGSIFEDAFNWYVYSDYLDLPNSKGTAPDACTQDSAGDPYHDGLVTAIVWNECSNVDSDGADQHIDASGGPADGC